MKRKFKKTKRTTFAKILAKSLCTGLAVSALFGVGFQSFLYHRVNSLCNQEIETELSSLQQSIANINAKYDDTEIAMREINFRLMHYTTYDIYIEHFTPIDPQNNHAIQIVPGYTPKCHAVSFLSSQDEGIVASNRRQLSIYLFYGKNKEKDVDRGYYICPADELDMPEIDKLCADYDELSSSADGSQCFVQMTAESVYVNKKEHKFIPHKGKIEKFVYQPSGFFQSNDSPLYDTDEILTDTKEFDITADIPDYELIELKNGSLSNTDEYPRSMLFGIWGEKEDVVNQFTSEVTSGYSNDDSLRNFEWRDNRDGTFTYGRNISIYLGKEQHWLSLINVVDYKNKDLVRYYWLYTIGIAVIVMLISVVYAIVKSTRLKAKYAMEDYQRDLTNNLAHDIKTPLMAIGGYTENLIENDLSDEEKQRYLHSILDNVAFTDSMISRTLMLNSMDGSNKLKREKFKAEEAIEKAIEKYSVMLDEKNITFKHNGSAEVNTNHAAFETIIENLVSNAVKYTSPNGEIKASADKKRIIITNSVDKKIDTKKLKDPFVRGDEARSNADGSGLGLSIAERAALTNGIKLSLSCTDNEFKAELRF